MAVKKTPNSKKGRSSNQRKIKIYRLYGINIAIEMLRPEAKWEWASNIGFTRWDDPRPQPTKKEIEELMKKIKLFEDSIDNTIWTEEQILKYAGKFEVK